MRISDWSSDVCSSDLSPRSCSPRSCSCVTATRRQHFALAHVIGSRDQTLFLHALDDAGGAVVADLEVALHKAGRCLAVLQNHRHGAAVEVVATAFPAEAAAAVEVRSSVGGDGSPAGRKTGK